MRANEDREGVASGRGRAALLALTLILAGCGPKTLPTTTFVAPRPAYAPLSGSGNGFDAYCLAATEAEKLDPTQLRKVAFTDREYENLAKSLAPALSTLRGGIGTMQRLEFRPSGPFQTQPYTVGWRILGEAMIGQLKAAVKSKSEGRIVELAGDLSQFGADLTHGDVSYATQGFGLLDLTRQIVTPVLKDLSAGTQASLALKLTAAARSIAPLEDTLVNEADTAGMALQTLQDMHVSGKVEALREYLGEGGKDLVEFFHRTSPSSNKRVEFFQGLKQRLDDEFREVRARASKPASQREDFPKEKGSKEERLAGRLFLQLGRTLLTEHPVVLARTRLFALYCHYLARTTAGQALPAALEGLPPEAMEDPFTGKPFVYHANGSAFEIYSVGKNGTDDDGKGGPTGTDPDVRLENFDI